MSATRVSRKSQLMTRMFFAMSEAGRCIEEGMHATLL
jgi:hypothetical protein